MVELPGRIAGRKQATPAQVARAWESWIVPVPGTTTIHRLEENAGTVAVALTAADFCDIHVAASQIEVRGPVRRGRATDDQPVGRRVPRRDSAFSDD